MPFLFALFARRWARWRRRASVAGVFVTALSFVLSSFSTNVWHLILTQGVLAALGCALMYSPTTLTLGEWFSTGNRALAYGIILSSKNVVGSTCPFLLQRLLDDYGFRTTLRIWAGIVTGTALGAIYLIPDHPSSVSTPYRSRKLSWTFLRHRTFYIYSVATLLQSSGYGIPQTYLSTYAHNITALSQTASTLLITLFNIPGIISSSFFGYLTDNKRFDLSASAVTAISATSSALSAWLLWGLSGQHHSAMPLLTVFSITFGFFAGGYSATWGGILNEMEKEAIDRNEALDTGVMYGLLNGARGIGYVSGGLAGVPLLKAGMSSEMSGFAYGTDYGPLIVFTGLCSIFGGWSVVWKSFTWMEWRGLFH
jgi:MFS family permease